MRTFNFLLKKRLNNGIPKSLFFSYTDTTHLSDVISIWLSRPHLYRRPPSDQTRSCPDHPV